jgi:hypothetical protein
MARQNHFLEDLGETFQQYGRRLELLTVVRLVEAGMRLWYHLDPRVYSENLRIRRTTEGRLTYKGNRFLLFVLFSPFSLPGFTRNLIDAVARSRLNLVIVSNAQLHDTFRSTLLESCHLLVERVNLGRDFGAYKDGIAIIRSRYSNIDRLIIMNDSMFFFEKGLDHLIAALDGEDDFIGLTEVLEIHYHVQSFMLSFGRRVLYHEKFLNYWQKYRPISTRRWAIHKGEVGLTRRLTRAGFKPVVLYHGGQLLDHLRNKSVDELLGAVRLLPTRFRKKLFNDFADINLHYHSKKSGAFGRIPLQEISWHAGYEARSLLQRDLHP